MILDYTLLTIILGTSIMGLVSGAIGVFTILRRQSLLGDAVAHAALPGIAMMFLLTYSTNPFILLTGGALSGWIATLCMEKIITHTPLKKDAALGIVLSVFFGFGLLLMTLIQKLPTANQSILNKFLFGNASTLLRSDIQLIALIGAAILVTLLLIFNIAKAVTFDPLFGATIGLHPKNIHLLLTTLAVFAIMIGLQTVGVVLMSAMLIAPAAAARQWTNNLPTLVISSGILGASSAIIGTIISSHISHMPTGPAIVVVASIIVIISLLFGPPRSG
ncbi:MAG: metal ABC transporter permease [Candidatus Babeliales bacterium]